MANEQAPQPEQAEEQVLYQEHPAMFRNHPVGFILSVILCAAGVGIVILLVWYLKAIGTTLTVTNHKTMLRKGILSKYINEMFHRNVRDVQMSQRLMQRICHVGTITISSSTQADDDIIVHGLPHPEKVQDIIAGSLQK
jgi:uncharacterized membrane protein YdbT with pleckstrin-like domain